MLGETKQVCYNSQQHSVHMFYWTRETSTPCLRVIRRRQIGVDGVRNEQQHGRYRVKLLNVSRFMDEAALDAFIRSRFSGSYSTFQEPKYGRQMFQTGAWEIYFKSPGCPSFLDKVKFINWMGKKILVQHVGTNPAPPCYNCGVSGH
ncbi:hypothetical protein PHYSODRAFT_454714, partial [Phytophthora sojae]